MGTVQRSGLAGAAALVVLSLNLGATCGGEEANPVQAALQAYEPVIEPVLQESENISKLFVTITLDKVEPDGAVTKIKAEAIPLSQQVADKAAAIQIAEPTLQAIHAQLVEASNLRLDGYKLMVQGFETKNLDTFSQGKEKLTESKKAEGNYVAQLDALSRQWGVKIDFFPPTGPAAP